MKAVAVVMEMEMEADPIEMNPKPNRIELDRQLLFASARAGGYSKSKIDKLNRTKKIKTENLIIGWSIWY